MTIQTYEPGHAGMCVISNGAGSYVKTADHIAKVERLRKALEMSHAALDKMCEWHGATHEEDCPEDDTCGCLHKSVNDRVNEAFKAGEAALEASK